VRRHSERAQRTIARPVEVAGIGFLTGAEVRLRFLPAPPDTGVVFVRVDCKPAVRIPARVEQVTGTARRTTLGEGKAQIGLVEHVLASLSGLRIDNCVVELNAPEPPGLDGSAQRFVDALLEAGVVLQAAKTPVWTVDSPVVVTHQGATLALHPGTDALLKISYFLDYGIGSPIDRQVYTQAITPESFFNEIASSRTFILESEIAELRRQGLGSRTTTADLLVFGQHGPIDNELRFADEPARHKALDIVGDLALFANGLCGHIVAYRSGHPLNIEMVRVLTEELQAAKSSYVGRVA
jgi:UDP-3-O-[3-hydroxymyristoyl] N-acetylglucosamine deacetylase